MATSGLRRLVNYAGLAKDVFHLRRADEKQLQAQARRHLIERLGKLRGLPQKMGQILSFSSQLEQSDSEAAADYAALRENAKPLPWEIIESVLQQAWGRPVSEVLAEVDTEGKAASLGQVHRAITRDGLEVAVKVQYPEIQNGVMTDLKMLGWLSLPVGNLRRGFDLAGYQQVILDDLHQELDYRTEASRQRTFHEWSLNEPSLIVPRVVDELCRENVLVSEWEEGDDWETTRDQWDEESRRDLGRFLLRFFLEGIFLRGYMHADWHPGNFRFRRSNGKTQVLLYDFGSVLQLKPEERLALLRLVRAAQQENESPYPIFLALGFQREYLEPMAQKLPPLCRVLFEPFRVEYPYPMEDWRLGERVNDILGEDRWNFRIAGSPSQVFLLRAWHGLVYYLGGLKTPVPWRRTLEPILGKLQRELDALPLPDSGSTVVSFQGMARYMKIRVKENGRNKVELTAYSSGVDDLENLLDTEIREKISQRGIDLPGIVSQVRRRGYTPGPVFQLSEGNKVVDVWLE